LRRVESEAGFPRRETAEQKIEASYREGIFLATTWAEIIGAAKVLLKDIRWDEDLATSPALFYRAKSQMIPVALPMLNKPPELLAHLTTGMTEPQYDSFEWVSTTESTAASTEVDTGMIGYELCSCVLRTVQPNGTVLLSPYAVEYDAETGTVTFPEQDAAGLEYDIDFYTDGSLPDLTAFQERLFALAVVEVWYEQFDNDWLDQTPKIHDSSFTTVNEANYLNQSNIKKHRNRTSFNDELRAYEQLCAYTAAVKNRASAVTLV